MAQVSSSSGPSVNALPSLHNLAASAGFSGLGGSSGVTTVPLADVISTLGRPSGLFAFDPAATGSLTFSNIFELYNDRPLVDFQTRMAEMILFANATVFTTVIMPLVWTEATRFMWQTAKTNYLPFQHLPPHGIPRVFTSQKSQYSAEIEAYGGMGQIDLRTLVDPIFGKEERDRILHGESVGLMWTILNRVLTSLVEQAFKRSIVDTLAEGRKAVDPHDVILQETVEFGSGAIDAHTAIATISRQLQLIQGVSTKYIVMQAGGRMAMQHILRPADARNLSAWTGFQDYNTMQVTLRDLNVDVLGNQVMTTGTPGVFYVEIPNMTISDAARDPEHLITYPTVAEYYGARQMAMTKIKNPGGSTGDILLYNIDTDEREEISLAAGISAMGVFDPETSGPSKWTQADVRQLEKDNKVPEWYHSQVVRNAIDNYNIQRKTEFTTFGADPKNRIMPLFASWDQDDRSWAWTETFGSMERDVMPHGWALHAADVIKRIVPEASELDAAVSEMLTWPSDGVISEASARALVHASFRDSLVQEADGSYSFRASVTPEGPAKRFKSNRLAELLRNDFGGIAIPTDAELALYPGASAEELAIVCASVPMMRTIVNCTSGSSEWSKWSLVAKRCKKILKSLEAAASSLSAAFMRNPVFHDPDARFPWFHVHDKAQSLLELIVPSTTPAFLGMPAPRGVSQANLSRADGRVPRPDINALTFKIDSQAQLSDDVMNATDFAGVVTAANQPRAYTGPVSVFVQLALRFPAAVHGKFGPLFAAYRGKNDADKKAFANAIRSVLGVDWYALLTKQASDVQIAKFDECRKKFASLSAVQLAAECVLLQILGQATDVSNNLMLLLGGRASVPASSKSAVVDAFLNGVDTVAGDATIKTALDGASSWDSGVSTVAIAINGTAVPASSVDPAVRAALITALRNYMATLNGAAFEKAAYDIAVGDNTAPNNAEAVALRDALARFNNTAGDDVLARDVLPEVQGGMRDVAARPDFAAPTLNYMRTPLLLSPKIARLIYSQPTARRLLLAANAENNYETPLANVTGNVSSRPEFKSINAGSAAFAAVARTPFETLQLGNDPMVEVAEFTTVAAGAGVSPAGFNNVDANFGNNYSGGGAVVNNASVFQQQRAASGYADLFGGPWKKRLEHDFVKAPASTPALGVIALLYLLSPTRLDVLTHYALQGIPVPFDVNYLRPMINFAMAGVILCGEKTGSTYIRMPFVAAMIDPMNAFAYIKANVEFVPIVDKPERLWKIDNLFPRGYHGGFNARLIDPNMFRAEMERMPTDRPSVIAYPVALTEPAHGVIHFGGVNLAEQVLTRQRSSGTLLQQSMLSTQTLIARIHKPLIELGLAGEVTSSSIESKALMYRRINVQLLAQSGTHGRRSEMNTWVRVKGQGPCSKPGMQEPGARAVWLGELTSFPKVQETNITTYQ